MRMLHRNILANYAARLWGVASVFVFVPLYVNLLGVEAYAIIAFQAMLLSMLLVADAGLSAAFTREAARKDDPVYLRDLLHTLERVYLGVGVALAAALALAAPAIATRWLDAESIGATRLAHYVTLMGLTIPLQISMGLYHGGLMGLQRQATANALQVGFSATRSGLVILPLLAWRSLYVFFAWQVGAALLFLLLYRRVTRSALGAPGEARVRWSALKGIRRFALGMAGMATVAAFNTQADKLVTSKMLSLTDFAYYSLAQTLAQAPMLLTMPIALAVLPQLTRLSESREEPGLARLYLQASFAIAALASIVGVLLLVFPGELVLLWTRRPEVAQAVPGVVRILAAGTLFLALQLMPYHLAIANGHNATNLRLGVAAAVLLVPATVVSIRAMGLVGAAIPWLVMNVVAFVLLGWLLTGRFLPGQVKAFFRAATLAPVAACAAVGALAAALTSGVALRGGVALLTVAVTGLAMLALVALQFHHRFGFPSRGRLGSG